MFAEDEGRGRVQGWMCLLGPEAAGGGHKTPRAVPEAPSPGSALPPLCSLSGRARSCSCGGPARLGSPRSPEDPEGLSHPHLQRRSVHPSQPVGQKRPRVPPNCDSGHRVSLARGEPAGRPSSAYADTAATRSLLVAHKSCHGHPRVTPLPGHQQPRGRRRPRGQPLPQRGEARAGQPTQGRPPRALPKAWVPDPSGPKCNGPGARSLCGGAAASGCQQGLVPQHPLSRRRGDSWPPRPSTRRQGRRSSSAELGPGETCARELGRG